jgi:adenylosuccinate synthase
MGEKTAVIGMQWGDEGKGKVIDFLAREADMVVRAQGGSNAGHTVVIGDKKYALHLIPSGVLSESAINIIGGGVAFDMEGFLAEIETLAADGVSGITPDKLFVSDRAHIVFPYHKTLDALGNEAIGTTVKGVGPCYVDKAERSGIRLCDIFDEDSFAKKLSAQIERKNEIIKKLHGGEPLRPDEIIPRQIEFAGKIKPFVRDTSLIVHGAIEAGSKILFEGAQATMLDLDLGTYPFVTSSNPTSGGFSTGVGISPRALDEIIGVAKAYTTRVGTGPFVTELRDETGDAIRERGHEFGTTTGRPRRCGWLDTVVLKYAARVNGLTKIALMLLDVLGGFDELNICHAYELDGKTIDNFPARAEDIAACKPIYKKLDGWKSDISGVRNYADFPAEAKAYVECIEEEVGVPVSIISVGPDREQTVLR